jgi:hypothetical protein
MAPVAAAKGLVPKSRSVLAWEGFSVDVSEPRLEPCIGRRRRYWQLSSATGSPVAIWDYRSPLWALSWAGRSWVRMGILAALAAIIFALRVALPHSESCGDPLSYWYEQPA